MLDAGPAARGWDEDQCQPLAGSLTWCASGSGQTTHWQAWICCCTGSGGAVQVPARRAAERDEAAIAAWREVTWRPQKHGGGPGRLAGLRRRVRAGLGLIEGFLAGTRLDLAPFCNLRN